MKGQCAGAWAWTSEPWRGNSMSEVSMRIDIDKLTEAELIDLNNRVVARLQFLAQTRAHALMLEFKIGDRVSFQPDGHRRVVGMLTRYNRKTVTAGTSRRGFWAGRMRLTAPATRRRTSSRYGRRDRRGVAWSAAVTRRSSQRVRADVSAEVGDLGAATAD